MAEKTVPSANIPENHLLTRLIAGGATNATAMRGYVGPSTTEGYIVLYPSLDNISESIEIARDDILEFAELPESVLPLGGTIVWVKKDAKITFRSVKTVGKASDPAPKADFAEMRKGRLRMLLPSLRRAVPPCQSHCSGDCQSTCGGHPE
jgi:hypothetical protein